MTFFRRICSSRPAMGNSADRAWQLSQLVEGVLTACNPSRGSLSYMQAGHCVSKQIGRHDAACQDCPRCVSRSPEAHCFRVFARAVRVSQPAVLSALLVVQLFGIVIPPIFLLKSTKRSAAAILGRSAPSLLFMVRFRIFCCRQISLLCLLGYHPILLLSISHLSIFLRNRLNRQ